jgi:hypothetical protein
MKNIFNSKDYHRTFTIIMPRQEGDPEAFDIVNGVLEGAPVPLEE